MEASSSKKSKEAPEALDIPHGIPKELLEIILGYITEAKDISKVERVNKTFRDISWKSFTCIRLTCGSIPDKYFLPAEFSQWFPTMWRKCVNLKRVVFGIPPVAQHMVDILLLVKRMDAEMHRNVEWLGAYRTSALYPMFPMLLEGWSSSLRTFAVQYKALRSDHAKKCIIEMTAVALLKCSKLKAIDISYHPTIDLTSLLRSLKVKSELRELTLTAFPSHQVPFAGISGALIESFQSIHRHRLNRPSAFRLSTGWEGFLLLAEALTRNPAQLELFTEMSISHRGTHFITRDTFNKECQAAFGSLPRLNMLSCTLREHQESCAASVTVISRFLDAYSEASHSVKLSVEVQKDDFGAQTDERGSLMLRHMKEVLLGVREDAKVVGEIITDLSGLLDDNPRSNWDDTMELEEKMMLKFVKAAPLSAIMPEFLLRWRCPLARFNTAEPIDIDDKKIQSERFRVTHDGIGFDFRLGAGVDLAKPGIPKRLKQLGFGVCLDSIIGEVEANKDVVFIEKEGELCRHSKKGYGMGFEFEDMEEGSHTYFNDFLEDIDLDELDSKYGQDGMITFGYMMTIDDYYFDYSRILDWQSENTVENDKYSHLEKEWTLCQLIEDVKIIPFEPLKTSKEPDLDDLKALDFQIKTSDGYIIWCHKNIIGKRNEKFKTLLLSAGFPEAAEARVEVKYTSMVMKEILHVIYTNEISEGFQELYLDEILDAANDYDLPFLKLRCERKLIEQLKVENCAELLELAHRFHLKVLKNMAINLATENMKEVMSGEKGKELRDELRMEIMDASDSRIRTVKMPCIVPESY